MAVLRFHIPDESLEEINLEGFDMKIDHETRHISIKCRDEPGVILKRQMAKLKKGEKAHLAIIIAILTHGGAVQIDAETFLAKFKGVDPDFPGITTI
ncbi:hypothetical protein KAR91_62045 [Candidatus Pacearchaeota archaeon]|nr:hypothetical protein [Candidatus Pacearchaeota archaeon]